MEALKTQIAVVAEKRRIKDTLIAKFAEAREIFEQDQHDTIAALKQAEVLCQTEETMLRDLTLAAYQETGNKAPAPGVGIRVGSKLLYDAGQALSWAKQHGLALKLDVPAFEKIAKASPPDFVATEPQITATIATDLDAVLKEPEVKP